MIETKRGVQMKRKSGIAVLGLSILAGVNKVIHIRKKAAITTTALPLIYAGTWFFTDQNSQHQHKLEVTMDLDILLDGRKLAGTVEKIDERELLFLDNYGYHLRIDAIDAHPVSVYDEADNQIYRFTLQ